MNSNTLQNSNQQLITESSQSVNIDFKRILFRAIKFWYLVVLSMAICLSYAFIKNRYAVRIYPVTASIIIKETEEASGGDFVYSNPLVSYYRNYLNELYILKSYPLIEKAIDDLNFETAFYREGNFLTTEEYKSIPVVATVDANQSQGGRFYFMPLSEVEFLLKPYGDDGAEGQKFTFGESVKFGNILVRFDMTDAGKLKSYLNQQLLFTYNPPSRLVGGYIGKLGAAWAEEGAGVVNLSTNGPIPAKEIDFLKGLIEEYQRYDLEKKNLTATLTVGFISDQLESISDSLRHAEIALEAFKNKNVVTDMSEEASRLYKRIEDLEAQKAEAIVRESYYKYLTDYIGKSGNLDQIILPSSIGITDGILSGLVARMVEMQGNLKVIGNTEKASNPLINDQLKRINEMKASIIEAVENQKALDQIKLSFVDKSIAQIERQMDHLPGIERQFIDIKRDYSLLESLYVFLLQKRAEAAISKASNTSDIVVVNPPMLAGGPITPKIGQNYTFAIILGLGFPIVVFILFEVFNTRIQSREDIEKITNIPFIVGIGHKKLESNLEVLKAPKSAIAESFRALRSNLNYFMGGRVQGVFLITSSISGEGKTFTSINLASVLALSGKKTLIIGADLRKPRIFGDLDLTNSVGLSNYLAGTATFEEVIQQTKFDNLYLVSGGPVPPNPSELLLTEKMEAFINKAKGLYEYVIIDSPPMALVTDAFTLALFADHTLFVVRQNYTPKTLLKTADDFYQTGKLKNISIVFNDIYQSGPGYGYGYGYGSKNGYGYYSES